MVRPATPQDIEAIAHLFDGYRVFYEKTSDVEMARIFLQERMQNEESIIFVSEAPDKTLTGFVQLYPLFSSTRLKKLWLLNDLYVHPDHRGKGYSTALIEIAKDLARTSQSAGLILETSKNNTIGNQLYLKTGFELDEDHHYYSWSE